MIPLALRALLSRVPGIAWVSLFVASLVTAAGVGLYRHGVTEGRVMVHRRALGDSVFRAAGAVVIATRASDSSVAEARTAATSSRVGRAHTRAVLETVRDSAPAAAIAVVEAQLTRDSTTIAVQSATIDTLLSERGVREQLDTLREHQVVLKPPSDDGISFGTVAKDVTIVAIVIGVIELILSHLHR